MRSCCNCSTCDEAEGFSSKDGCNVFAGVGLLVEPAALFERVHVETCCTSSCRYNSEQSYAGMAWAVAKATPVVGIGSASRGVRVVVPENRQVGTRETVPVRYKKKRLKKLVITNLHPEGWVN